jgi:hypothetical protein
MYDRQSFGQCVLDQSTPLELTTRFLLLSDSCGFVDVGALSLTRGRVCRLNLLLALASAVFLGFESSKTRDNILLSQIRDFLFRRLLRLAGSRWRYSTPPPDGVNRSWNTLPLYRRGKDHSENTALIFLRGADHIENTSTILLRGLCVGTCLPTRCLTILWSNPL